MFIINDKIMVMSDKITQITPYVVYGSTLSREVDKSNPAIDLNPDYVSVSFDTFRIGALIRLACGTEHAVYRLAEYETGTASTEALDTDAEAYVRQIAKLVFPNKMPRHLKIGR